MKVLAILIEMFAVALWYWYACKRLLRQLHMAQQNSYRPERFMRWLKARFGSELLKRDLLAAIVLAVVGFVTDSTRVMAIVGVIVFGLLLLTWKRPVEKKPLVFTVGSHPCVRPLAYACRTRKKDTQPLHTLPLPGEGGTAKP